MPYTVFIYRHLTFFNFLTLSGCIFMNKQDVKRVRSLVFFSGQQNVKGLYPDSGLKYGWDGIEERAGISQFSDLFCFYFFNS